MLHILFLSCFNAIKALYVIEATDACYNYLRDIYRTEDVVVMYTAVPKTGSTTLTQLVRHLPWRNEIRNVWIGIVGEVFRYNLSTLDQVTQQQELKFSSSHYVIRSILHVVSQSNYIQLALYYML